MEEAALKNFNKITNEVEGWEIIGLELSLKMLSIMNT